VPLHFLAYFLEYVIVRTSSVCLSVGRATTFHEVARLGRFMARSIVKEYCILLVFKKGSLSDVGPGG
jgi:hypothetical protein